MKISVLGTGCAKCKKVEEAVRKAVEESGADATVLKVEDIREIAKSGVTVTPAVAIDGVVRISGRVPTVAELKDLLAGE